MARIVKPGTVSAMIAAVARGGWVGQRKGVHISLTLDRQTNIFNERVEWRAYRIGNARETTHAGRAGTVFEALDLIERAMGITR